MTVEQNASAAGKGFLFLFLRIRTCCPPDFQVFINKINITNATVGHSKRFPHVFLSAHT